MGKENELSQTKSQKKLLAGIEEGDLIMEQIKESYHLSEEKRKENEKYVSAQVDKLLGEDEEAEKRMLGLCEKLDKTSWMYQQEVPAQKIDNEMNKAYGELFKGRSLSRAEREKRSSAYTSKVKKQQKLNDELMRFEELHSTAVKDLSLDIYNSGSENFLKDIKKTTKAAEYTRDFAAYAKAYDRVHVFKEVSSRLKGAEDVAVGYIFSELENLSVEDFTYKNEEEFLHDLHKKYAKLRLFERAEALVKEMEDSGNAGLEGNLTKVKARLATLKAIREDYDTRIQLMQSPYYVLIDGKDIDKLSEKEIEKLEKEAGSKDAGQFLALLKQRKKNTVFKQGTDAAELDKKILKKAEEDEYRQTKTEIAEIEEGIKALKKAGGKSGKIVAGKERAALMARFFTEKYGFSQVLARVNIYYTTTFNEVLKKDNPFYKKTELGDIKKWLADMDDAVSILHEEAYKATKKTSNGVRDGLSDAAQENMRQILEFEKSLEDFVAENKEYDLKDQLAQAKAMAAYLQKTYGENTPAKIEEFLNGFLSIEGKEKDRFYMADKNKILNMVKVWRSIVENAGKVIRGENIQLLDMREEHTAWVADTMLISDIDIPGGSIFYLQKEPPKTKVSKSKLMKDREQKDLAALKRMEETDKEGNAFNTTKAVEKQQFDQKKAILEKKIIELQLIEFKHSHDIALNGDEQKILDQYTREVKEGKTKAEFSDWARQYGTYHFGAEVQKAIADQDSKYHEEDHLYMVRHMVNNTLLSEIKEMKEKKQLRNDITGELRRSHILKYKTEKDIKKSMVEKDVENLYNNCYADLVLGGAQIKLEEPLLGFSKAYAIFMRSPEIMVQTPSMKQSLEKKKKELIGKELAGIQKAKKGKEVSAREKELTDEMNRLEEVIKDYDGIKMSNNDMSLKLKAANVIIWHYMQDMYKFQAVKMSRYIIAKDPTGLYRTKMDELLKERESTLGQALKTHAIEPYINYRNGGGANANSGFYNDMIDRLAGIYDELEELKTSDTEKTDESKQDQLKKLEEARAIFENAVDRNNENMVRWNAEENARVDKAKRIAFEKEFKAEMEQQKEKKKKGKK